HPRPKIDLHQPSSLFGGRYTYSFGHISPTVWSRRASLFGEGLFGITHATSGLYPTGPLGPKTNNLTNTATGFTSSSAAASTTTSTIASSSASWPTTSLPSSPTAAPISSETPRSA